MIKIFLELNLSNLKNINFGSYFSPIIKVVINIQNKCSPKLSLENEEINIYTNVI